MGDKEKQAEQDLQLRWANIQGRLGSAREIIEKILRIGPVAGAPTMMAHFPQTMDALEELLKDLQDARDLMTRELRDPKGKCMGECARCSRNGYINWHDPQGHSPHLYYCRYCAGHINREATHKILIRDVKDEHGHG